MAVGDGFTVFCTEDNKIWAVGQKLLQEIDVDSKVIVDISSKLPEGFPKCKRVWANACLDPEDVVVFAELEHQKYSHTKLFSVGMSQTGLLGQTDEHKKCMMF